MNENRSVVKPTNWTVESISVYNENSFKKWGHIERVFIDVTAAMLVNQTNEKAAMLMDQANPVEEISFDM